MKRFIWLDFLCAIALFFSACSSAIKTVEVEEGMDERTTSSSEIQSATPSAIRPLPTRTMDLDRPDKVRETYAAAEATIGATGPNSTPRPSSTPTPFASPVPTVDSEKALSPNGPWLVFEKAGGGNHFFAVNMDGTGKTVVNISEDYHRIPIFSPSGNQMAYVEDVATITDQRLIVARFPDGKIEAEIPLFASNWEKDHGDLLGHGTIEQAIGKKAWSPGGRYLAFVGALDGPSCDLYVFDLSTKTLRRLTDGPHQPVLMGWSPDGEWIVHQSVVHFGTGAGITGESVWAAALDGSEVRYLYSTQRQQSLAGWMDPSRIVIYEWGQPYGAMNVLRVSLEGGQPFKVYDGPLGPTWVFDLEQGIVVFQLTKYEVQQDQPPGIYLSSIQSIDMSQLVLPGEWGGISYWDQGGLFLAIGDGGEAVGFDREGEIKLQIEISEGMGCTVPSPENNMFAVYNDQGAWIYDADGGLIRQVVKGEVQQFLWGPSGTTFFVLVGENNTLLVGDSSTGDLSMIESGVRELKLIG